MENLKAIQNLEGAINAFLGLIGPIAGIAGFLFLTVWGWLIIGTALLLLIIRKSRNKEGRFSFGNLFGTLSELLFSFYSNITSVIIGLILLFFMSFVYSVLKDLSGSLTLYREVKMLEAALKNLKTERKIMELRAGPKMEGEDRKIQVKIKFYAYSPAKDADIAAGDAEYIIPGRRLFADFGVFNFDYSLIEKGLAKNIAFPYRLYSDSLSHENGESIFFRKDALPYTFSLDEKDIYILDRNDYQTEIFKIISAVTNESAAHKLGVRTSYGEAFGLVPNPERTYTFYSTGTGGIIVR